MDGYNIDNIFKVNLYMVISISVSTNVLYTMYAPRHYSIV